MAPNLVSVNEQKRVAIRLDSFGRRWALAHFLGLTPPSTWPIYSTTGSSPRSPHTGDMRERNEPGLILFLSPKRANHDATRTGSS